jgi:hypothetical protein
MTSYFVRIVDLGELIGYLGNVIKAGGVEEAAVASRTRCAWKNFNELKSILTRKGLSVKVQGRVYGACVRRVMLYGSET